MEVSLGEASVWILSWGDGLDSWAIAAVDGLCPESDSCFFELELDYGPLVHSLLTSEFVGLEGAHPFQSEEGLSDRNL
jgi:hypothetical protein